MNEQIVPRQSWMRLVMIRWAGGRCLAQQIAWQCQLTGCGCRFFSSALMDANNGHSRRQCVASRLLMRKLQYSTDDAEARYGQNVQVD